ncbi:hypothetical protein Moror_9971 [Moniliophthora roreri MCA 2997]|uniref:Uncharacterized protein n=1 Tax=Moniliophthora roreri (strain MCA 2997) TaxID=1381753 RepID=V2WFP5_MONRO|nr:hypothetical protein Moror_9971 [Moniliophthora roreri MCA 2997]
MFKPGARNIWKQALVWSRVKLVYTRITLTKYTTLYFFLALIYCIVLVALQGVAYQDNTQAANIVSSVLGCTNITGLVVHIDNHLELCTDLPNVPDSNCFIIKGADPNGKWRRSEDSEIRMFTPLAGHAEPIFDSNGLLQGVDVGDGQTLSAPCVHSLLWLNDALRDSRREDLVILTFHVWLFALSFVAILNESLPHLVAGLAGHALVTGWGGFRVENTDSIQDLYQSLIVKGTCNNTDFLGGWWETRYSHTIPTLVLNAVALICAALLSLRLYKVYARQSLNRVGASSRINWVYKLVLILSVCLQLAGFFTLASTVMWIDKASSGTIVHIAKHLRAYQAVLIIMAVFVLPWVILGWGSVRREQRRRFLVFSTISIAFLVASSAIFASPLYRFIFDMWPLFATMTITSYILIVAVSVTGILCRLHFGRGLKEFLAQTEAPEGADFAPVYISQLSSPMEGDTEKGRLSRDDFTQEYSKPTPLPIVQQPPEAYTVKVPRLSVFSDPARDTVKLSSMPPLAQDAFPQPEVKEEGHKPSRSRSLISHLSISSNSAKAKTTASSPGHSVNRSLSGRKIGLPSNPRQFHPNGKEQALPMADRSTEGYF